MLYTIIKQLKKIATTFDILNSLEWELSEQDYTCVYRWLDRDDFKQKIKEYNDNKKK